MCSAEAGSYLVALLPIPLSEVREAAATHLEAHGASLSAPAAWLLGLGSCIRQQLNWQASVHPHSYDDMIMRFLCDYHFSEIFYVIMMT